MVIQRQQEEGISAEPLVEPGWWEEVKTAGGESCARFGRGIRCLLVGMARGFPWILPPAVLFLVFWGVLARRKRRSGGAEKGTREEDFGRIE